MRELLALAIVIGPAAAVLIQQFRSGVFDTPEARLSRDLRALRARRTR